MGNCTKNRSAEDTCHAAGRLAARLVPWLGMTVPFTFISRLFVHIDDLPDYVQPMASPYPGFFLICALAGASFFSKGHQTADLHPLHRDIAPTLDFVSSVLMAVSSVLMALPVSRQSIAVLLTAQALGGMSVAWMYMRWGVLYCRLEMRRAVGIVCLSVTASGILKILLTAIPGFLASGLEVLLALFGLFGIRRCYQTTTEQQDNFQKGESRHTMRDLWIFPLALVVLCGSLGFLYNVQYSRGDSSTLAIELGFLLESIAAFSVYWWVCIRKKALNVVGITAALSVVIASGTVILSTLGASAKTVFTLCTNIDHSLLTLFLWIILTDLGNRLGFSPSRVFAAGWLLRSVPFWFMGSLAKVIGMQLTPNVCSVVIYSVVIVLALVILGHNVSTDKLLDSLYGRARIDKGDIEQRCLDIAKTYGLTPRETDVLVMLGRGSTRPYIAEVLDLSENTVRGYTKNVYRKLGIHDRQSLFLLIEGITPASGGNES